MNCEKSINTLDDWMIKAERFQPLPVMIQTHLDQCGTCSVRFQDLTRLDSLVAANAVVHEPSPFLWTRLEARLAAAPAPRTAGWLPSWLTGFPSVSISRRQWVAAMCLLVLVVSTMYIGQQVTDYRHYQLLVEIDEQWNNLKVAGGGENPFRLGIESSPAGHENPFPILGDTSPGKNPFSLTKS